MTLSKLIRPLLISGPSGVGKGTLVKKLLTDFPKIFKLSVSHTTRKPREGEKEGVNYYYTNKEDMKEAIKNNKFIEHATVHDNLYGTSFSSVEEVMKQGFCCILEIDYQGAINVRKSNLNPFSIFVLPPSLPKLETRLKSRGTETDESIKLRIYNARNEIEFAARNEGNVYDEFLVNDDIDNCYQELKVMVDKNVVKLNE
eukprot:gene9643-1847_t